jgi:hypothetical protein
MISGEYPLLLGKIECLAEILQCLPVKSQILQLPFICLAFAFPFQYPIFGRGNHLDNLHIPSGNLLQFAIENGPLK